MFRIFREGGTQVGVMLPPLVTQPPYVTQLLLCEGKAESSRLSVALQLPPRLPPCTSP